MLGSPALIGTKVILKTPPPSPHEQAGFSRSVGAIGNVNSPFRVAFVWYVVLMYLTFNDLTEC